MEIDYNKEDKTHCVIYNGKAMTLRQVALELGLSPQLVANRMRRGWSFEQAIYKPVQKPLKGK